MCKLPRYAMDFSMIFTVQTENPDPDAITPEQIVAALRERVRDLLATDPENVMAETWPPTVFDHGVEVAKPDEGEPME